MVFLSSFHLFCFLYRFSYVEHIFSLVKPMYSTRDQIISENTKITIIIQFLHGRMSCFHVTIPFACNSNMHFVAGGYIVVKEKLPNYVVPDLIDFKVLYVRVSIHG